MRLLFVLLGLLALPLPAQQSFFLQSPPPAFAGDRTQVEVLALISQPAPGGFLPVRVTATNQRESDARLHLQFDSREGYAPRNQNARLESGFSIEVPAGGTTQRDLLVPLVTRLTTSGYGQDLVLEARLSGSFGNAQGQIQGSPPVDAPAVAMSEPLHSPNASALDAELASHSSHSARADFAARFDALRLPDDWRAFSGFDIVMMTDEDWTKAGPGARTALLQWCRLGGRLEIHAQNGSTSLQSLDLAPSGTHAGLGLGEVERMVLHSSRELDPSSTVARLLRPAVPSQNQSQRQDYSTRWPLHTAFGSQRFDYGLFVAVLVAFGILVGPVNLFLLARSGRRHRLFLTTPLISIGTSLLLIALILIKDGTGGHGRRVALIEVQPDEHTAYVHQEQISRTGVLFGGGFELTDSAVIAPVPLAPSPWARLTPASGGAGLSYRADFADGHLRLGGDWFQSRSEQGQTVRAVVPTRGRIEVVPGTSPPELVSTFSHPVEELYYLDRSGARWVARDLHPGSGVTSEAASPAAFETFLKETRERLGERNGTLLDRAVARGAGHFLARTSQAPALETYARIRWDETDSILTGPVARTSD